MEHKKMAMPSNVTVNNRALDYAKQLIEQGKINCNESTGENTPIVINEENYLKNHTMEEYGKWFLATNDEKEKSSKDHYEFPLGNFNHIYRDALLSAKKHAALYKYELVEYAADELLRLIDQACHCMTDLKVC